MKVIIDIAKAELKKLFFSPVAFLLLVIFTFLMGSGFQRTWGWLMTMKLSGIPVAGASGKFFCVSAMGYYEPLLRYIHFFFPLLTMNIMSRDMGSGAFKLLLSSPVKNRQIILGKYLSMVVFSLLLCTLIFVGSIYALWSIDNVDTALAFSGILGIFLLCCTYAAIGLYMSSITNYPIVAAIGTLCVLMILASVGTMWQDVPMVRDISYWLSFNGRARNFIKGMIASEDLIYFLTVILFFLSLTLIRLRGSRIKKSGMHLSSQYIICISVLCVVGYFTSKPVFKWYWDVSRTDHNTLTPESRRVMNKLDGGITITTYANVLDNYHNMVNPSNRKKDELRFEQYTRFNPYIKLKYVYYIKKIPGSWYEKNRANVTEKDLLDTLRKNMDFNYDIIPYDELKQKIDLSSENFNTVRVLEKDNGQKTYLRFYDDDLKVASESEITAALKRLAEPLPKVGFITGHGERAGAVLNDRGYSLLASEKSFRYSLINNGFDFEDVSLMAPIPDYIEILIIADARKPYSQTELKHFKEYIDRGGNLFICGEPNTPDVMNQVMAPLGVNYGSGRLVHAKPNLLQDMLALPVKKDSKWKNPVVEIMPSISRVLMVNGCASINIVGDSGYKHYPIFETDSTGVWNELETQDLINDSGVYNPSAGESYGKHVIAMAMEKKVNGKEQRIIITGDADWLSNGDVLAVSKQFQAANYLFLNGVFYYLSGDRVPINTSRIPPTDNTIRTTKAGFKVASAVFGYAIPVILLLTGLFIWIRRKGK